VREILHRYFGSGVSLHRNAPAAAGRPVSTLTLIPLAPFARPENRFKVLFRANWEEI
jgi:hypothetical protein